MNKYVIDKLMEAEWELNGGLFGNIIFPFIYFIIKWIIIASIFWMMYSLITIK